MTFRVRKRTVVLAMAVLLGLNSAAMAQDQESAPAKSGGWLPWLSWNKPEGDVDLNKAVALSSSKPRGLKKLGQRLFGPSKSKDETATSYSVGDVRVNGTNPTMLGPGSYKVGSKGWQPSKSPYAR